MTALMVADAKKCSRCSDVLPLVKFHKNSATRDGRQSVCKACMKKLNATWVRNNPDRQRARTKEWWAKNHQKTFAYNITRVYGVTYERYCSIVESQGGGCAICGLRQDYKRLGVDHDHATGAIRGVLCGKCNTALGLFDDDQERLKTAILYLNKSGDLRK